MAGRLEEVFVVHAIEVYGSGVCDVCGESNLKFVTGYRAICLPTSISAYIVQTYIAAFSFAVDWTVHWRTRAVGAGPVLSAGALVVHRIGIRVRCHKVPDPWERKVPVGVKSGAAGSHACLAKNRRARRCMLGMVVYLACKCIVGRDGWRDAVEEVV